MATTSINPRITAGSGIASAAEIRAAFAENREELMWLAEFLSDDLLTASACVTDARDLMENNKEEEICSECLQAWTREAIVRSVLDLKRTRIAALSSTYELEDVVCRQPQPMSSSTVDLVVRESDIVCMRLDSLCRFAVVLCGFEQRSADQAARFLGVSKHAVEAAYSRALEILEVIYCQTVLESYGLAVA